MNKYDPEHIKEKMTDFLEFRDALRDMGHSFSEESEVSLYALWRH